MAEVGRSQIGAAAHLAPSTGLSNDADISGLRTAILECLDDHIHSVVIDFSRTPLLPSAAAEMLLDAQEELSAVGGTLSAANLNAVLQDLFYFTNLDERIEILDKSWAEQNAGDRSGIRGTSLRLGEMLIEYGLVEPDKIEEALALQEKRGQRMAQIMVEEGWLAEKDLLRCLAEQLSLPLVWLRSGIVDPDVACLLPEDIAKRLGVIPLIRIRDVLFVATNDPQSMPMIETVEDLTNCRVRPILACSNEILEAIDVTWSGSRDLSEYMGDLESDLEIVDSNTNEDDSAIDELASGSPVINLINGIVLRAVQDGASDIHIEPSRYKSRIRARIDGVLYTIMSPPIEVHPALISRLKVMANLDIAERRMPQDGRIQVVTQGRVVDLRFSSLPGIFGEKVVLRVLDKSQAVLDVDRLGLTESNLDTFKRLLGQSYGLILVTGPTGSGKTTTLYAALNHLASDTKNVVTIEDPVEYQIDGILQNQTREQIGLGFAKILKHVLRQDPDIIMVGEIREQETARIAVQAALTGHLVVSTLHTNDSIGAITRLIDMGVEPFLLSSALIGVMAQRLVRTVCQECKSEYLATPEMLDELGLDVEGQAKLVRGRGCAACYDSGYRGRMAIHEIVDVDPELQRLIVSNPARDELDAYLASREHHSIRDDGLARAVKGESTVEEVLRVVNQ
ncbi:MAG: ATPase, T2SS/T4P/T4SS family [Myxococcota bacterium]